MTVTDAERLAAQARGGDACVVPAAVDEDAFRAFYDRTARTLWAYLSRTTGDRHAADDLLQEAYYRFIRSGARLESEEHRRHYLFRVATNLVRDRHRRAQSSEELLGDRDVADTSSRESLAVQVERRRDLRAAFARLKPRERELLWLAYAEGSSHHEIAETLGVRASGVRVMLFRARRRLGGLLESIRPRSEGGTRRGQD
jgi:RNA polymerase sigma-70 factor (ECF subfamily)